MITYCVLSYNRTKIASVCIPAIFHSAALGKDDKFVIWDNASSESIRYFIKALESDPRVSIVFHNQNIGVAAYQQTFKANPNEFFCELDNDVLLPHGFGPKLAAVLKSRPTLAFLTLDLEWLPLEVDGVMHRRSYTAYHNGKYAQTVDYPDGVLHVIDKRSLLDNQVLAPGFCRMSRSEVWNSFKHPDLLYGTDAYMSQMAVESGYEIGIFTMKNKWGEALAQHIGADNDPRYEAFKCRESKRSFGQLKIDVEEWRSKCSD